MKYRTKDQHLDPAATPKRILALDGGGVRGILTLGYLERIEARLREQHDDPELRLSDYFDLIGGTSTGAIIAAGLAQGMTVDSLAGLYRELAATVFQRRWWRRGVLIAKYTNRHLDEALKDAFHEYTRLGSDALVTGLMVMTKRMDTGSPWPLVNNPRGSYWAASPGRKRVPNSEFPLWRVVRASTAAPHYFGPEHLDVGRYEAAGETIVEAGQFIDGGVTTANNPSLQLLQVAVFDGFGFGWRLGADNLLLVSVGTGAADTRVGPADSLLRRSAAGHAGMAVMSLIADCAELVETMMQWMSNSPTARLIDRQIGTLDGDLLGDRPLLSYLRYNVMFEEAWMRNSLGVDRSQADLDVLAAMDNPDNVEELWQLGQLAASRQISDQHFPDRFNLTSTVD